LDGAERPEAGAKGNCLQRSGEDWNAGELGRANCSGAARGHEGGGAGDSGTVVYSRVSYELAGDDSHDGAGLLAIDVDGYAAGVCGGADADLREGLSGIGPALLANGASESGDPAFDRHALAALIPRARYLEFAGLICLRWSRLRNLTRR